MIAAVALPCLIGLLALLSLLEAHHPGEARDRDRKLAVVASVLGLVVLVLAINQVLALTGA